MFDIVPFDDRSQKHPVDSNLPPWLPKHEFLMIIVAPAGSGKTTLLLNIILRIYTQYWHRILIFSPTIHNDAKWEHVKEAQNVLIPKDETKLAESKTDESKDHQNKEDEAPAHSKAESDEEDWCKNEQLKDLMDLKENEVIDPFKYKKNDKNSKRQRVGLSKVWFEKAMETADDMPMYDEHPHARNVYADQKRVKKDDLMKRYERVERLSSLLVRPPIPVLHKQLHDLEKSVFRGAAVPRTTKKSPYTYKENEAKKKVKQHAPPIPARTDSKNWKKGQGGGDTAIKEDDMFEEYSEDTLVTIMNDIDEFVKECKNDKKDIAGEAERTLWVFDDMVGSGLFNNRKNNAFKRLTVRRRHYFSSLVGVTQAYKEIPKTTRTNANCLILFRIDSEEELQTIYREYPMGHKFKDWLQIVEYCTSEPYSFVMFNLQTSDLNCRIIKNFDEPITLEKQQAILHSSDLYEQMQ
jgi:energy-coupling factor transporter ATP-binding protein EcfA2